MSPPLFPGTTVTFSSRSRSLISGLPGWLEKLLFIVLCWQFARLFWVLFAPAPQDVTLFMPRQGPDNTAVSHDAFLRWYGGEAAVDTQDDYSLVAVIAGRNGAAVLRKADGSSVAIKAGAEISPGSRLLTVEPNQITIERAGVRQVIRLPQKTSPALFADAGNQLLPAKALPPMRISRGQMAGIVEAGNLGTWDKGLSTVAAGGIRVDNATAQPLAQMLKLKNGDILKSINGRRLDQLADISLLFHFFAQQSAVDLVLVRDGASFSSHYDIQP